MTMSEMNKYLLDTNVLIEAHRRYYAFDIAPSFWNNLYQLAQEEKIISIDYVKNEISNGDEEDKLNRWANSEFERWFVSTNDEKVFASYRKIIDWVTSQTQYADYAKSEFARIADSWLLAYALAFNCTIVTHESYAPQSKNRVLIPNVCKAFEISYISTFDMLRNLNVRL